MKKNNLINKILNYRGFGLIVALILLLICAAIFTPAFYSFNSISSMLTNNAVYAILAVGIMFVLITGGIDISIGSILAVSGVTVSRLTVAFPNVSPLIWLVVGILAGCICGFINGFLVGKMKIVPMIVTLGTMYAYRGAAYVISQGKWTFAHSFSDKFMNLAQTKIFGINAIILWSVAALIVAGLFLTLTKPGRRLYAVGTNEKSALIAGINTAKAKLISYVLCGGCAGLAGVLYASNYAMVNSDIATGYEMTAIAICILGGVSIVGGKGSIDGLVIASLLMSVITYLLSLLPGFSVWQSALQGAIILVAVIVNIINGRISVKRILKGKEALI